MSHLLVGVHEENYIAHVVEYATEMWSKQKKPPKSNSGNKLFSTFSIGMAICLIVLS